MSLYILFPNHSNGMLMENILIENNIKYTISPTPRELSICCGISIIINKEDRQLVEELIEEESNLKIEGIHELKKKRKKFINI
ncbi:putative Se/S carrier-like protein [Anaeromicrobium sediminis]|uniref:Putative Se/S carrier protein-like domain-containing protein n=1 Tax=Anaeromicrobium sediminis TaxID=1478221 RepID=A0A267MHF9_9FIRM|nr:putative Se/S carrier-like protein [Anaeromicrobium sediminis]PAB59011.1 hypothetical protein CCE28_12575 [Anaeromicrobium sediminis]